MLLNNLLLNFIHSLIFMPTFPPGRVAQTAALGGFGIAHSQQQLQIILLAAHQDRTKQGLRCSHSTWCLNKLWADFPWVSQQDLLRQSSVEHSGQNNLATISRFGEVAQR